jgi:ArsR family transcriptional regulator, arsenate/arsenite/antimonite-responsive transcriptional repressor
MHFFPALFGSPWGGLFFLDYNKFWISLNKKMFDDQFIYLYIEIYLAIWGDEMKQFIRVMKALSDPGRVKIIKMLENKAMCVCEIREALGLAQPTISKHLKILEDSDLVVSTKDGLWVNYRLPEKVDNPYAARLLGNLKDWLNEEEMISKIIERLPLIHREDICKK